MKTIYVRDLNGDEYAAQATLTNKYELNGQQSVEATFIASEVNRQFIDSIAEMWSLVDHDGVEHRIVMVKRHASGDSPTVEVTGVPLFFDVLDTERIYDEYNEHMTAMQAFTRIFDGLPFTFAMVDSFDAVQWEGFGGGETRLETFKRALDRYGAEFRIIGNTVELRKLIGRDTQFQYRARLNASNIVEEADATGYWTYAKGYGDYGDGEGGEDWQNAKLKREYTSPLAQIPSIGLRHAPPIKNGNITQKQTMDDALKTLVDESLKLSVSADIHDLRTQGYPLAQPELGDRVFLTDERIGLDAEVRVIDLEITRNWRGEVRDLKLTFGSPSLARRQQARLDSAVKSIADLLAGKVKLPAASVYDDEMRNAVTAIQNAQTELDFPVQGGIIAIDKTDPNKQVWLNSAGLMVSKTGGATAEAAITGEGVVAEKIIGRSIIGVNLTSADNTGFFHVTGPYAQFYDMLTRRTLDMSPTGIYGYAPNNPRPIFQADRTLVTSSAIGTAIDNVYLAAQSGFEARVVDMAGIPGDGNASSYTYLPLRAQGIYANYIEPNGATAGVNLYARPRAGGEFRVTGSNTTDVYYPLRAANIFGTGFISTTTNAYVGSDGELRVVNKGFVDSSGGTPIYRDVRANTIYGTGFVTTSSHAYIGTDSELRVVNKGLTDIYRDVRGLGFIGNRVGLGTHVSNAIHFHVQPALDGEVQITDRSGNGTFRPIRARDFITDTSDRGNKTGIVEYTADTLDVLRRASVYNYRRKKDDADAPMQLGLMIDEMPAVTHSETGDSFALYALNSYAFKAIKDVLSEVDALKLRIEELEGTA